MGARPAPPGPGSPDGGGSRHPAVGQVIETLGTGGAENLAIQIANELARRGWPSHLYVLTDPAELSDRVAPEVRIRYLHRRRRFANPLAFALWVLRGVGLLRARVRADGVRLLQTHLPAANYWGLGLSVGGVCRAIATIHNNEEFSYGSRRGLRLRLRRLAYRQMLRRCAAVISVSAEVRASLLAELGAGDAEAARRAVVVANGVTIPEPLPEAQRRRVRDSHGVDEGTALVLAAGRLCEQKNFGDLVAAGALLAERPRWRILVAGDGPDRAELEGRIAAAGLGGRIRLLGNVAAMSELMRAADVFVLPSLWEGLPLALLEAMACGLPVVGNRIKGIADIAVEGSSALLVEPRDVPGLAAALGSLLDDPEHGRRLGAAGLEIVRRQYDFRSTVDQLEELYTAALARP